MFFVSRPPTPYRRDIDIRQQRSPRHGRRKRLFFRQSCLFCRQVLPPMSTLMVSSPRSLCLTSLCFDLGALSQQFSLQFIWSVAMSLSGQSKVFSTPTVLRRPYPTRRNLEVRCEGGATTHYVPTYNPKKKQFATPNLLTYGIEQRVRIYSHSQIKCMPRCLN